MKTDVKLIRKSRKYSEEFKRKLVCEFETGKFSVMQLSRLHKICFQSIYRWIYKYSNNQDKSVRIVEMADNMYIPD